MRDVYIGAVSGGAGYGSKTRVDTRFDGEKAWELCELRLQHHKTRRAGFLFLFATITKPSTPTEATTPINPHSPYRAKPSTLRSVLQLRGKCARRAWSSASVALHLPALPVVSTHFSRPEIRKAQKHLISSQERPVYFKKPLYERNDRRSHAADAAQCAKEGGEGRREKANV